MDKKIKAKILHYSLNSLYSTFNLFLHINKKYTFGSTSHFMERITEIPKSPIVFFIQVLRNFPIPWWCEMLPPQAIISSLAAF